MLKEFRDFLVRGNLVEPAVALPISGSLPVSASAAAVPDTVRKVRRLLRIGTGPTRSAVGDHFRNGRLREVLRIGWDLSGSGLSERRSCSREVR